MPASIATIVTMGYGSFGSAALVVTLGYGISGTPALTTGYRIAASQAIVPGAVASQSRVPSRTQQAVNAGSEASESR